MSISCHLPFLIFLLNLHKIMANGFEFRTINMDQNKTFTLGNFGKIPWHQRMTSEVFYSNDDYFACNHSIPKNNSNSIFNGNSLKFIMVNAGHCFLQTKARNVEALGFKMMILVTNNSGLAEEYNFDDGFNNDINIPTLIVNKDIGQRLKSDIVPVVTVDFDFVQLFNISSKPTQLISTYILG